MDQVILKPWHEIVSIGSSCVLLEFCGGVCSAPSIFEADKKIDGFYAKYPEGLFAFFMVQDGGFFISWRKNVYKVDDIRSLEWRRGLRGRQLKLELDGSRFISFMYQSLWSIMIRPVYFFTDVLLADDDWGLEADLPSFFHSLYVNNTFNNFLEMMERAEPREPGRAGHDPR